MSSYIKTFTISSAIEFALNAVSELGKSSYDYQTMQTYETTDKVSVSVSVSVPANTKLFFMEQKYKLKKVTAIKKPV